jgi:16S rRNA C1402 (ribose-2'-O) methylase RsmI
MLNGAKDQISEIVTPSTDLIDFNTAKKINNDLIDILRVLSDVEMRTQVGKEVQGKFMELITFELQKLEESIIIL